MVTFVQLSIIIGYRIPRPPQGGVAIRCFSLLQYRLRIDRIRIFDPSRYAALKVRGGDPREPGAAGLRDEMRRTGVAPRRHIELFFLVSEFSLERR